MDAFLTRLAALPLGYGEGDYRGRRYGVTLDASADGRRRRLFGEELGGPDRISGNLYRLADGRSLLKPCEMAPEKVVDFVLGFRPAAGTRDRRNREERSPVSGVVGGTKSSCL